ncbi:MAG: TRAP transporter small permease subunit [Gemmobacter sp.]
MTLRQITDAGLIWVDWTSNTVGRLVSVCLPAMVAVIGFEVVARYAFAAPTRWAYDMALLLFAWAGMLGGAAALRRDAHIRVDIVTARLGPRGRAAMDLVTLPFAAFFLGLVVWQVGLTALDAWERGLRRPTDWAPPLVLFLAPAPLGATLLLLQAGANAVRSWRMLWQTAPEGAG